MERKIGEIFEYDGEWYQTVKPQGKCYSCDLFIDGHCVSDFSLNGSCFYCHRKDGEDVMFKKLEKAEEPIIAKGRTFQRFTCFGISCEGCVFNTGKSPCDKRNYIEGPCLGREIWVEVKQNEENMEEKKLNLKSFNLEEAKAGKPVCTRDGRNARILGFDAKGRKPISALVESRDGKDEEIVSYTNEGKFYIDCTWSNDLDLVMCQEKGIWVARDRDGSLHGYDEMPYKDEKNGRWYGYGKCRSVRILIWDMPEVRWEDEKPKKLIIK